MTDRDREDIVVECTLDAPPEKVWRALTEPDLVAAWLLPEGDYAGAIRPGADNQRLFADVYN